jgi:CHASE1-domain containing sensor protein
VSRRKIPIAVVLGLLVLATTLPLGLFAGRLIWTSWKQQQAMVARQNIDTARAISVGVDQEVRGTIAALNVLASVDAVDGADWRAFYDLALRMLPLHQNWYAIRLIRPSGEILVNTEIPLGQPSRTNADWVVRVRDTGHPAVSLLHQGRDSQEFFISVGVPVVRSGSVVYVLGARLRATASSRFWMRTR